VVKLSELVLGVKTLEDIWMEAIFGQIFSVEGDYPGETRVIG
jgi:hypothetical protein